MHLQLALACVVALALLYAPGFFFMRACRLSRLVSLIAAPIASVAGYSMMSIVNGQLHISSDALTVAGPVVACALVSYGISRALATKRDPYMLDVAKRTRLSVCQGEISFEWIMLGCYVLAGTIVCFFMFDLALVNADSFYPRYDNQTHINLVQSYLDTGAWSSLHSYRYLDLPEAARSVPGPGGFYPAAWHALVALVCLLAHVKVTVASNACVIVLASVVLPAGAFLLNKTLLPENRLAIAVGAIIAVAFANFPWVFVLRGPTFPNMLGFAVMIPAISVFMLYLERRFLRKKAVSFALFCIAALVAMGLSHPSTVFTAFIFLAPYGGHFLDGLVKKSKRIPADRRLPARVGVGVAYVACLVGLWALFLHVPLLQGVLNYKYGETSLPLNTIVSLITLNVGFSKPQFMLPLACLIGIIYCLRKRRFWLLIPVFYMALLFFIARLGIQPLTRMLTGFWYSTPYRLHSGLAVFLIPVASMGLACLVTFVVNRVRKRSEEKANAQAESGDASAKVGEKRANTPVIAGLVTLAVFVIVQFFPTFTIPIGNGVTVGTPFGTVAGYIKNVYDPNVEHVYSTEEIEFVDEAMKLIPDGALVLNQPHDGSVFAYGANELTTYYRQIATSANTKDAQTIRTSLANYATDPDVQAAVQATGAQYLLQLDHGVAYEDGVWMPQYRNAKLWEGIDAVDDDTPGFEVVLARDDMRLYRIVPVSELPAVDANAARAKDEAAAQEERERAEQREAFDAAMDQAMGDDLAGGDADADMSGSAQAASKGQN